MADGWPGLLRDHGEKKTVEGAWRRLKLQKACVMTLLRSFLTVLAPSPGYPH